MNGRSFEAAVTPLRVKRTGKRIRHGRFQVGPLLGSNLIPKRFYLSTWDRSGRFTVRNYAVSCRELVHITIF